MHGREIRPRHTLGDRKPFPAQPTADVTGFRITGAHKFVFRDRCFPFKHLHGCLVGKIRVLRKGQPFRVLLGNFHELRPNLPCQLVVIVPADYTVHELRVQGVSKLLPVVPDTLREVLAVTPLVPHRGTNDITVQPAEAAAQSQKEAAPLAYRRA